MITIDLLQKVTSKQVVKDIDKDYLSKNLNAEGYIKLDTNVNGVSQNICLKPKQSNLNDSTYWMFYSPTTKKCAFKMYLLNDWLYIRDELPIKYYDSQIVSKAIREKFMPQWEWYANRFKNEMNKPYFKPFYNDKATKRYMYLQRKDFEAQHKKGKAIQRIVNSPFATKVRAKNEAIRQILKE